MHLTKPQESVDILLLYSTHWAINCAPVILALYY